MNIHKRIHIEERPNKYNICTYSCSITSLYINVHKLRHTGENHTNVKFAHVKVM